jgi:hypothetical protein
MAGYWQTCLRHHAAAGLATKGFAKREKAPYSCLLAARFEPQSLGELFF